MNSAEEREVEASEIVKSFQVGQNKDPDQDQDLLSSFDLINAWSKAVDQCGRPGFGPLQ